jgi:transposase
MAKSLSMDLRSRVLAAVEGGLSCRGAAARFGVSVSSAIRWHALRRRGGDARPGRQGGDRRSARIEAHAPTILGLIAATPDLTLAEIRTALAALGASFGIGTIWRFFRRHRITLKKRPRTRPNKIGPTSGRSDLPGSRASLTSTRAGWFASTRPGPPRR